MASVQNSQHFKKTKWPPRKFEHFTASGRSENTFHHILHDLGYILHSPKPLLFVKIFVYLILPVDAGLVGIDTLKTRKIVWTTILAYYRTGALLGTYCL